MWACNANFGNTSHVFSSLSRYFHLPWLLDLVCFYLFQKSAVVVESVKQIIEVSVFFFKYIYEQDDENTVLNVHQYHFLCWKFIIST